VAAISYLLAISYTTEVWKDPNAVPTNSVTVLELTAQTGEQTRIIQVSRDILRAQNAKIK
jgi:hypothetical protein